MGRKQPRLSKTQLRKKHLQSLLLREITVDFDWSAAAKRAGVTPGQLATIKKDEKFMTMAENLMHKSMAAMSDAEAAVQKFKVTQEILIDELKDGNMTVASNVLKSHEMEFRMHGLFEKDNKQKGEALVLNITMHAPEPKDVTQEAIEHVTEL
jgi:hypothetical protein